MGIDKTYALRPKPESISCKRRPWRVAVICLSLYFCLYACTTSNYGTLQPSSEITDIFENNRIASDHLYYYSGLQGVPDAIIAVHRNYSLRSYSWRRIEFSSPTLKTWVFRMSAVPVTKPQGAWILDPDGNRIGIWFASQRQTVVRVEPNNRVVVVPPAPTDLKRVR